MHYRSTNGALILGGILGEYLASVYGTPLLVFDISAIRMAIDARLGELNKLRFSYASKAFLCTEFAKILSELCVGLDVCSLGELQIAESAAFRPARITMHGAGKTDDELRSVVQGRVGRIVVDGLAELGRLADLARGSQSVRTVLRVNTGIDADTHRHVRTSGEVSKFGFFREEEDAAADILLSEPALQFEGLHAHAGSQITNVETLVANVSGLVDAAERFTQRGLASNVLIGGGGFAVQYDPDRLQDALDVGRAISACAEVVRSRMPEPPTLEFEPGRCIVAHAGTTLYQVLAVKRRGEENIIVVDGGMADNPRPAIYGAYHHITPVAAKGGPLVPTSVFGRACEDDFMARTMLSASLERGDLVAACTTGAYTYSMASNYNGFPRPAVVGVHEGSHQLWIERR